MNPFARLMMYQQTKQIRTRSQLHPTDRVAKYLIDIDYLGSYNLEETKNCKSSFFKIREHIVLKSMKIASAQNVNPKK